MVYHHTTYNNIHLLYGTYCMAPIQGRGEKIHARGWAVVRPSIFKEHLYE